jgi:diguanylate cyclase (GGDEF)-like protein
MSELIDNLADLTALRDRDALDVALVTAINDVLQPRSAAICRVVGEQGDERWRICAQLRAGHSSVTSDSAWSRLDALPALSAFASRQQALASRSVQVGSDACHTVFALASASDNTGVLELHTDAPLSPVEHRLVNGVLRLYGNFSDLLDYGERDSLTGLLNRKTFDGAFLKATLEQHACHPVEAGRTIAGERRDAVSHGTYWLAMIDIDHFKRVNDNFGHLIGDEVLLLLARLMRTHFRFHDQLYRFGGEEFVVLMRCHDEAEARTVLERLRLACEEHAFPQVGTITISLGFSEIRNGDSPSDAFARADRAVYYAKEHGRNQVRSYAALVSHGDMAEQAVALGEVELF